VPCRAAPTKAKTPRDDKARRDQSCIAKPDSRYDSQRDRIITHRIEHRAQELRSPIAVPYLEAWPSMHLAGIDGLITGESGPENERNLKNESERESLKTSCHRIAQPVARLSPCRRNRTSVNMSYYTLNGALTYVHRSWSRLSVFYCDIATSKNRYDFMGHKGQAVWKA
jgi:hypothetical protein